jgi:hypothetical protein
VYRRQRRRMQETALSWKLRVCTLSYTTASVAMFHCDVHGIDVVRWLDMLHDGYHHNDHIATNGYLSHR